MKNEDSQDYGFRDVVFMTAGEKNQVLRDWERFIESSFERRHFTDRLYKHLTLHCSFIAHYNIAGFYDVYFGKKRNTDRFIDQFTSGISSEYGMDYWLRGSYGDINNAMCEVMRKYSPDLKKKLAGEIEKEDIGIARALLAKHGKDFKIEDDGVF
jgi:hypothetical protein